MRILLIEDDAADAELLSRALRESGCSVIVADNADDGITLARIEQPDIIVCDINLQGMDGHAFALLAKADERIKQIPLVAITGASMPDEARAIGAGFLDVIVKSTETALLAGQIVRYTRREDRAMLLHRLFINRSMEALQARMESQEDRMHQLEMNVQSTYLAIRNEFLMKFGELGDRVHRLSRSNYLQVLLLGISLVIGVVTLIAVSTK